MLQFCSSFYHRRLHAHRSSIELQLLLSTTADSQGSITG